MYSSGSYLSPPRYTGGSYSFGACKFARTPTFCPLHIRASAPQINQVNQSPLPTPSAQGAARAAARSGAPGAVPSPPENTSGHVLHAPRSAARRPAAGAPPGPPPLCYPLLPAEVAMQRKPHWNPATILIRERVLWVTLGILVWVASTTLLLGTC